MISAALVVVVLATAAEVPPVEGPATLAPMAADSAPGAPDDTAGAPAPPEDGAAPARPPPPPVDIDHLPPPSIGVGTLIGPMLKTLFMLGIVVALAYLTLHKGLGKLVERQNLGKRVKVLERVALDPRRSLFLVEIDGKQMLIGSGEGGVVHLKDLGPENDARGARFADALEQKRGSDGGRPAPAAADEVKA